MMCPVLSITHFRGVRVAQRFDPMVISRVSWFPAFFADVRAGVLKVANQAERSFGDAVRIEAEQPELFFDLEDSPTVVLNSSEQEIDQNMPAAEGFV
jgi:hypothetical protein